MYNFLFLIAETKEKKKKQANSVSYRPINHDVKTKEGKNLKSSFVVINQYQPKQSVHKTWSALLIYYI